MKYYETHAHYDDKRYNQDRSELLGTIMPAAGVGRVINIGADMKSSRYNIELVEKYDYFLASVGVHPHYAKNINDGDLDELLLLSKHEKVVAIGEIGLDFHYNNSPPDVQIRRFYDLLEIVKKANLPVVIHCREANEDVYRILKENNLRNGGIIHCFSGTAEEAAAYVKMGYHIAFGGTLTYRNAHETVRAAKEIPLDHIVLETDCPYLAPEPVRGQRNDSRGLAHICKKLAEIKGILPEVVAEATWDNAEKLFER